MGFDSAFYRYPKYKSTTPTQLRAVEEYLSYSDNEWAKEKFENPDKYCEYIGHQVPSQDVLHFYKPLLHKDEFNNNTIEDSICWWGGNGIWLHQQIIESFGKLLSDGYMLVVDKDMVLNLLLKAIKRLSDFPIEPAAIDYAYTCEYDDTSEIDDIILRKCDGVELKFDDGLTKRVDTASEYDGKLYTFKKYIDTDDYYALITTIDNLKKVLEIADFENEVIYYAGG